MLYYILFGLCLLGVCIRTSYELLKRAGRVDPKNKVLFVGIAAAMGLMLASWFGMCPIDPWRVPPPGAVRWAGLGAVVIGWILALGALIQLRGVENIDHLVTSGVFSRLRHPMYTGFILWIVGWAMRWGAVMSIIAGVVLIGNVILWRELEEMKMESDYGDVYREYRVHTWF